MKPCNYNDVCINKTCESCTLKNYETKYNIIYTYLLSDYIEVTDDKEK